MPAREIPPPTTDALLTRWPIARLATVGDDGTPHQVPIVFARAGDELWSPVDGKPKSGRELTRVANLVARPRASLLLDAWHDDWSRLWWLRLDVTARVVRPPDPEADPEARAAVAALRAKYPAYETTPVLRDPPTLLAFRVLSRQSWCASPDALAFLDGPAR